MIIPQERWTEASGGIVVDDHGGLWRIVGFIDRPAVCLEPIKLEGDDDDRARLTMIMGCPNSEEYRWLVPDGAAHK